MNYRNTSRPKQNSRLLRLGITCALLLPLLLGSRARSDARDAELRNILKNAVKANQRLRNFSCVSRAYRRMEDFPAIVKDSPIVEKSPEGHALLAEYEIVIDRGAPRYRYDGRECFVDSHTGKPYSQHFSATFDGKLFRRYDRSSNSGFQERYDGYLARYCSLHSFLGDTMGGDPAVYADGSLLHWLKKPKGWFFESGPDEPKPRLMRHYRTNLFATEMRVHVTLSPDHDYLPSLIETYWCDTQTMRDRFEVEQFHKVMPEGTWVPVRGWLQAFYREAVFPFGITLENYQRMTNDEKKRIDPLVIFVARPLGPPVLHQIDAQSIKANQELADSTFVFEFPPTSLIYDGPSNQTLRAGKHPLPKEDSGSRE